MMITPPMTGSTTRSHMYTADLVFLVYLPRPATTR
jgi:hypothetical protein